MRSKTNGSTFHRVADGWVEVRGYEVIGWRQLEGSDTMEPARTILAVEPEADQPLTGDQLAAVG